MTALGQAAGQPRWSGLCAARPRDVLLAVAAALVLLWQALVVQPHVHDRLATGPIVGAGAHVAPPATPSDDPATCPLCRELAAAGSFLAADAPAFPVARDLAMPPRAPAALPVWARQGRSHAWRSRGPPLRA